MFEEDHAPVTLSEMYHQAASCQRTVQLAHERSRVFDSLLPLENYSDIILTGCGSSHHLAICASFAFSDMLKMAYWQAAARDLNPGRATTSGAHRVAGCLEPTKIQKEVYV